MSRIFSTPSLDDSEADGLLKSLLALEHWMDRVLFEQASLNSLLKRGFQKE